MKTPTSRRQARGFGLIDALIALAILAFGLLGMTRLQARSLAQATEAKARSTAAQLGDELVSYALVDTVNTACYTLPAAGTCASTTARATTDAWKTRLQGALKDGAVTSTYTAATGRFRVAITWNSRPTKESPSGEPRQLEANTDVR